MVNQGTMDLILMYINMALEHLFFKGHLPCQGDFEGAVVLTKNRFQVPQDTIAKYQS